MLIFGVICLVAIIYGINKINERLDSLEEMIDTIYQSFKEDPKEY